jgi:hypothetical protein
MGIPGICMGKESTAPPVPHQLMIFNSTDEAMLPQSRLSMALETI